MMRKAQQDHSTARNGNKAYRLLQRHLDAQAVGFPSVRSGVDLSLLKLLFTEEEAKLALHLSYKPATATEIAGLASALYTPKAVAELLNSMLMKGAIGWKEKNGTEYWFLLPLIVGMYEGQDGKPSARFAVIAGAYMKTLSFGRSFLSVKPSQMRTIPVNRSIKVEHEVAPYDRIRDLIMNSAGPFVVLNCICRVAAGMRKEPCKKTSRQETCLGFGNMGAIVLRRKHGREVTREEALAILQQNEDDGLVLQPANAREPEFVCSCCGCCCGMLSFQKFLPHPVDFWTSGYFAEVNPSVCVGCGKCVARCQVNAVTVKAKGDKAVINLSRCIGCGLCVPSCPVKALDLKKKPEAIVPPKTEEELYEAIKAGRKGTFGQLVMMLKVLLRMRLT